MTYYYYLDFRYAAFIYFLPHCGTLVSQPGLNLHPLKWHQRYALSKLSYHVCVFNEKTDCRNVHASTFLVCLYIYQNKSLRWFNYEHLEIFSCLSGVPYWDELKNVLQSP